MCKNQISYFFFVCCSHYKQLNWIKLDCAKPDFCSLSELSVIALHCLTLARSFTKDECLSKYCHSLFNFNLSTKGVQVYSSVDDVWSWYGEIWLRLSVLCLCHRWKRAARNRKTAGWRWTHQRQQHFSQRLQTRGHLPNQELPQDSQPCGEKVIYIQPHYHFWGRFTPEIKTFLWNLIRSSQATFT